MDLSAKDPFVIFGVVLLILLVIIAIVLLTVTQRLSAREVWRSVRREPKSWKLTPSAESPVEQDEANLEQGPLLSMAPLRDEPDLEGGDLELPHFKATKKLVRFSSVLSIESSQSNSPSFEELFAKWPSNMTAVEAGPSLRRSMSNIQLAELHLNGS